MQVDSYNTERALKKVKRHSTSKPMDVDGAGSNLKEKHNFVHQMGISTERLKAVDENSTTNQNDNNEGETKLLETRENRGNKDEKNFIGALSSWYDANLFKICDFFLKLPPLKSIIK